MPHTPSRTCDLPHAKAYRLCLFLLWVFSPSTACILAELRFFTAWPHLRFAHALRAHAFTHLPCIFMDSWVHSCTELEQAAPPRLQPPPSPHHSPSITMDIFISSDALVATRSPWYLWFACDRFVGIALSSVVCGGARGLYYKTPVGQHGRHLHWFAFPHYRERAHLRAARTQATFGQRSGALPVKNSTSVY